MWDLIIALDGTGELRRPTRHEALASLGSAPLRIEGITENDCYHCYHRVGGGFNQALGCPRSSTSTFITTRFNLPITTFPTPSSRYNLIIHPHER